VFAETAAAVPTWAAAAGLAKPPAGNVSATIAAAAPPASHMRNTRDRRLIIMITQGRSE